MIPEWLNENKADKRKKSGKQEKKLAKKYKGKMTVNSGATFGENDVETELLSIEAKTTAGKGFRLTLEALEKMEIRAGKKIGVFLIEFEQKQKSYVILSETDFYSLIKKIENGK